MVQYALVRDVKSYIRYQWLTSAAMLCILSMMFVFGQMRDAHWWQDTARNMEIPPLGIGFVALFFLAQRRDRTERLPGVKAWRQGQKSSPRQAKMWKVTAVIALAASAALFFLIMSSLDREALVNDAFGIVIVGGWCSVIAEWFIPHTFELAPKPHPAE